MGGIDRRKAIKSASIVQNIPKVYFVSLQLTHHYKEESGRAMAIMSA